MNENKWNPFLGAIIDLKRQYEKKLEKHCTYEKSHSSRNGTCVNRWINELNDKKFIHLFSGVSLRQYKHFIVAHYNDFFVADDENGDPVAYKNFFDVYNGFYMECRGVVVDVEKEKLVLVPFRKFMNLNEHSITTLECVNEKIKKAKCIEFSNKLDGSMISAGYYNGELVVSGSSCNDPNESIQVKKSIQYIHENSNYKQMLLDYPDETHIFEFIFPMIDPHVVCYKKEGLYLIGIRNIKNGEELSYAEVLKRADKYQLLTTEVFHTSLETILNCLDEKKSFEAEGFVINIDGFKVKIKYNDYVFVHRAISNITSANTIVKAIHDGTIDDLVSKVPNVYLDNILKCQDEVHRMLKELNGIVEQYYSEILKLENKEVKEVMIWIDSNVPKSLRFYVKNRYKGIENSFIKLKSGHYRSMKELTDLVNEIKYK